MPRNKGSKDSKPRKLRKISDAKKQNRSDAYQKRRRKQSQPAQQALPIRSIAPSRSQVSAFQVAAAREGRQPPTRTRKRRTRKKDSSLLL